MLCPTLRPLPSSPLKGILCRKQHFKINHSRDRKKPFSYFSFKNVKTFWFSFCEKMKLTRSPDEETIGWRPTNKNTWLIFNYLLFIIREQTFHLFLRSSLSSDWSDWLQEKLNSVNNNSSSLTSSQVLSHEEEKTNVSLQRGTDRGRRDDANHINFDFSGDEESVDSLQLHPVVILQHVSAVHSHLTYTQ